MSRKRNQGAAVTGRFLIARYHSIQCPIRSPASPGFPRSPAKIGIFVLRIVQPGLSGLMDGSVSTLAPIFATAFATHKLHTVFLIGAASAVGAGISMAFSEGLSDDGTLTGRGKPLARGLITGGMTFLGGFLHTLPFLIASVQTALNFAYLVVGIELAVISWIRYRFMNTSFALSCLQVIVGGGLVFAAGVLIGQS
jgi:VIT1/CCC1 family predicted Fe2+/Mn2+ transporter